MLEHIGIFLFFSFYFLFFGGSGSRAAFSPLEYAIYRMRDLRGSSLPSGNSYSAGRKTVSVSLEEKRGLIFTRMRDLGLLKTVRAWVGMNGDGRKAGYQR